MNEKTAYIYKTRFGRKRNIVDKFFSLQFASNN